MDPTPKDPWATLRRFARTRPSEEACELCGAALGPEHPHLVKLENRVLVCACHPCSILFSGRSNAPFRRIPRQVYRLEGFRVTDTQWDSLGLPIGLAFFFVSSTAARVVARYPSPAGPTESLLPLTAWDRLVAENPVLAALEPDVEALLVHRVKSARDYYRVPIDRCYQLVGLIRLHWRGFSGGDRVWQEIDGFFARLAQTASTLQPEVADA